MSGGYPPPRHVLRDLDFEVETLAAGRHRASYDPGPGRRVELGGVLTVVDLLAGTVCIDAVAPDWMATSGLAFHLAGPLPVAPLQLDAVLLRSGRNTVTIEVRAVAAATGELLGDGVVTFARIRRPDAPTIDRGADGAGRFSFPSSDGTRVGTDGSLRASVGCRVLDAAAGVTEAPLVDHVRNSFGAMNGGVVAALAEASALAVAGSDRPEGTVHEVSDLVLHYLAQGRTGPVRTSATALHRGWAGEAGSSTVRVEVVDAGDPAAPLMAIAHVGTRAAV